MVTNSFPSWLLMRKNSTLHSRWTLLPKKAEKLTLRTISARMAQLIRLATHICRTATKRLQQRLAKMKDQMESGPVVAMMASCWKMKMAWT
jgi:hypothetical protein